MIIGYIVLTVALMIAVIYIFNLRDSKKKIKQELYKSQFKANTAIEEKLHYMKMSDMGANTTHRLTLINNIIASFLDVVMNEPFEHLSSRMDLGEDKKSGVRIKLNEDKTGYVISDTNGVILNRSIVFEKAGINITDLYNSNITNKSLEELTTLIAQLKTAWKK